MRPDGTEFLETAAAIGNRICRDALWANGRCTWIGASMEPIDSAWTVAQRTLGPDLYAGTAGVALFLARLFRLTNETPYRTTAIGAIRHALAHLGDIAPSLAPSCYSGVTGIAYATIAAGETFAADDMIAQGIRTLDDVSRYTESAAELDIVTGISGAIPVLLSIHQRYQVASALDTATRFGDELLRRMTRSAIGTSWGMPNLPHARHLTGFSHGAAGIAWALLELHAVTGEAPFRAAAQDAFRYERHWFDPSVGNWPDFRDFGPPPTLSPGGSPPAPRAPAYTSAWCHGAPGIGFSRLRAGQLLQDPILIQEAETAIQTTRLTLEQPPQSGITNYSLCHGTAGNADLLLYASAIFNNTDYRKAAEHAGWNGIALYEQSGTPWPSGVTGGGETPNLFLGSAGTGYFYLRLANPALVPPVLIIVPEADATIAS